ncbi:hypothetical protein R70723_18285 [Paenibacillus sp. FSL R7-0273]|uniref:hypothetical protein n=1 Tax=Paenibacillus sp. FSL R7-0273 TaxID=1536772 RepID=UPI0004F7E1AD|nr:hypothetical protein [Paenibacillus sp. FSL R7-0273]AIQ47622.1 hypothetical protein R70723_18285 [Paenibacillus sp. FSL R7-0273]OMF95825.1 hypothetical protein BK144_04345 [Paenibacillus sp. FSL R7-0273]
MSKLDGNERWKTKMLMSEHVDQYEQQEKGEKETDSRTMLTNAERTMVRDLILLPYIDTMVSKSIEEIERSGNMLTKMYLMAGRYIQSRVMQDTYRLQKELRQRNIKVLADEQEDFLMYYKIFFRGYQERFGLTRDIMRTEISLKLTRYTSELGAVLKEQLK